MSLVEDEQAVPEQGYDLNALFTAHRYHVPLHRYELPRKQRWLERARNLIGRGRAGAMVTFVTFVGVLLGAAYSYRVDPTPGVLLPTPALVTVEQATTATSTTVSSTRQAPTGSFPSPLLRPNRPPNNAISPAAPLTLGQTSTSPKLARETSTSQTQTSQAPTTPTSSATARPSTTASSSTERPSSAPTTQRPATTQQPTTTKRPATTLPLGSPVAANDTIELAAGKRTIVQVLENDQSGDSQFDDDTLTIVALPRHSDRVKTKDNGIFYRADDDFAGTDRLTYRICNTNGLCTQAQLIITVVE